MGDYGSPADDGSASTYADYGSPAVHSTSVCLDYGSPADDGSASTDADYGSPAVHSTSTNTCTNQHDQRCLFRNQHDQRCFFRNRDCACLVTQRPAKFQDEFKVMNLPMRHF